MLQIGTVEPGTLDLLKKLMSIPELADFSLIAPVIEEGIRSLSNEDLMAMKINAILRRAVKKDFWDIAEILEYYTIEDLISNYNKKYPNQMLLISIPRVLTYFKDAENSDEPVSLKGQNWMGVKTKIRDKVDEFLK